MDWSTILIGVGGSAAAGAATGLGALPLLAVRGLSDKLQTTLLGFAAGVMLAASFFSLIIPGLEEGEKVLHSRPLAALVVIAAILLGAGALWAIDRYAPHEHFIAGRQGKMTAQVRRIWLFVIAITLHNVPEGLAVGVGFGSGDPTRGWTLALAIGLQNMPEGLAVAASLVALGYGRLVACLLALATGMVEPIGGFIGVAAASAGQFMLPWGLGFAAGAMLFVISHEIIPETHRKGHQHVGTAGLMVGLSVMMFLDVTLQ